MSTTSAPAVGSAQFGVVGLGVMGQNLALNVSDHGQVVSVWNLEADWVTKFLTQHSDRKMTGSGDLKEFVQSLARPRRILMMIMAGNPVDQMLDKLAPLLEPGDIVIDGGNSFFKDTQRREAAYRTKNLNFFGMGVSGGEEGARFGPSLMPGGDEASYEHLKPTLEAIAAKTDYGACVTYVGPNGAGHFVKMVHNGIEYGDMQLIAEAYDLLRKALGLGAKEIAAIFEEWNKGKLESYLIEITSHVLQVDDPETGKPLVDMILDKAGQKGTGKWTQQIALDLAVPIPTIGAALDARVLSSMKDERVAASKKLGAPSRQYSGDKKEFINAVQDALYASKVCSYAQGMSLIRAGSKEWNWNVNLREMARIWTGGCIIRARLLADIMHAFDRDANVANLLVESEFTSRVLESEKNWRSVVQTAAGLGIPTPAFSSSLAYFDSYRSMQLPQNLTQAQRDFFGAHTYQRADRPDAGFVHTDWIKLVKK
ncbi:6-phosphogluconate dehydrogenase (decarboxylating) [Candidatus Koribacter versatilis Ellin345]|uniref:6-phosphogluconate dehydrogenase, decarboxylating n=1 Tax=Koribacter versatilis (strain Ellin345) TaxID=204669 RepID=Q1IMT8_KORVE|nr:NADP-dependent phosphogluconate dehydrogenase [Candidatus Koribacter versatilis]ABF41812.1 6-phosphogluconate dehydrogenase (decarboxylating) [Candidatus Koribacter versatilis Ellin345]